MIRHAAPTSEFEGFAPAFCGGKSSMQCRPIHARTMLASMLSGHPMSPVHARTTMRTSMPPEHPVSSVHACPMTTLMLREHPMSPHPTTSNDSSENTPNRSRASKLRKMCCISSNKAVEYSGGTLRISYRVPHVNSRLAGYIYIYMFILLFLFMFILFCNNLGCV